MLCYSPATTWTDLLEYMAPSLNTIRFSFTHLLTICFLTPNFLPVMLRPSRSSKWHFSKRLPQAVQTSDETTVTRLQSICYVSIHSMISITKHAARACVCVCARARSSNTNWRKYSLCFSANGRSLVQGSRNVGNVSECDLETSTRMSRPTRAVEPLAGGSIYELYSILRKQLAKQEFI
jgi:hypothetical protein